MKVLVCGGRDYADADEVNRVLDNLHHKHRIRVLIHGAAAGADNMAGAWARSRSIPEVAVPAQWEYHGKRAGPMRNVAMLLLQPDLVVAFPGGRGTAHMVRIASEAGVSTLLLGELKGE